MKYLLNVIKLSFQDQKKAMADIQKFIEDEGGNDFGGGGSAPSGGGSWKPVAGLDSGGDAKLFIQKGSRMNDGQFDDDAPF